jgi:hypothetical protein
MERETGQTPGVRGQLLWAWENPAAKSSDRYLTRVRGPRLCWPSPKPRYALLAMPNSMPAMTNSMPNSMPDARRREAKAEALQSAREWIARLKRKLLF